MKQRIYWDIYCLCYKYFFVIGMIFFVRYCNKKRKSIPYLEMVITEDYVGCYLLREEGKIIKKIKDLLLTR